MKSIRTLIKAIGNVSTTDLAEATQKADDAKRFRDKCLDEALKKMKLLIDTLNDASYYTLNGYAGVWKIDSITPYLYGHLGDKHRINIDFRRVNVKTGKINYSYRTAVIRMGPEDEVRFKEYNE